MPHRRRDCVRRAPFGAPGKRFTEVALILLAVALTGIWPAAPSMAARGGGNPAACQELVVNGGFEAPYQAWTEYSSLGYLLIDPFYPHTGEKSAFIVGDNGEEGWIAQTVVLPANATSLKLTYWWAVWTEENPGGAFDFLRVQLLRVDNTLVTTLATYDNQSGDAWVWNPATADLSAYAGQTLQLRFYAKNDANNNPTSFFVDDVSIEACTGASTLTPTSTHTPGPSPTPSRTPSPSATPRAKLFLPLILR
jgi:hypothetical protein